LAVAAKPKSNPKSHPKAMVFLAAFLVMDLTFFFLLLPPAAGYFKFSSFIHQTLKCNLLNYIIFRSQHSLCSIEKILLNGASQRLLHLLSTAG